MDIDIYFKIRLMESLELLDYPFPTEIEMDEIIDKLVKQSENFIDKNKK